MPFKSTSDCIFREFAEAGPARTGLRRLLATFCPLLRWILLEDSQYIAVIGLSY